MYETLTGVAPFRGGSVHEILTKHICQEPVPLANHNVNGQQIQVVEEIIMRALQKEPAMRFQKASELKETLLQVPVQRAVSAQVRAAGVINGGALAPDLNEGFANGADKGPRESAASKEAIRGAGSRHIGNSGATGSARQSDQSDIESNVERLALNEENPKNMSSWESFAKNAALSAQSAESFSLPSGKNWFGQGGFFLILAAIVLVIVILVVYRANVH
jgi:serine/threonine protein kinase